MKTRSCKEKQAIIRRPWSLLLTLVLGGGFPISADILYSVTDLNKLGASLIDSSGINNVGQVTGTYRMSPYGLDPSYAFLYSNGQMISLGVPPGYVTSGGSAINDTGQITISASTGVWDGPLPHAFLYSNGQMRDLGTLGGDYSSGFAINNAGQVTGVSHTSVGTGHAFLYSNGQMRDLGVIPGDTDSAGIDINNSGQVVGYSSTSVSPGHAFLYNNGQMTSLGDFMPSGINDSGQVVGTSGHALLYNNGQITDLGTLPGDSYSNGFGLNNAGQVVGMSGRLLPYNERAFLYSNGQMVNLNDLIDPTLGITLLSANTINDLGQILASGEHSTYLLTPTAAVAPVPEPSTLALFGVALLGLAVWTRRQSNVLRNTTKQSIKAEA